MFRAFLFIVLALGTAGVYTASSRGYGIAEPALHPPRVSVRQGSAETTRGGHGGRVFFSGGISPGK